MMGFPEQDPSAFCALREKVYEEFFGPPETVSHELLPLVPHIDVFVYPPGHANRPFYTLAAAHAAGYDKDCDQCLRIPHNQADLERRD